MPSYPNQFYAIFAGNKKYAVRSIEANPKCCILSLLLECYSQPKNRWAGGIHFTSNTQPTHARTLTKIPFMIPRKGIAQPQSQYPHSCVRKLFIYSQDRSTNFPAAKQADQFVGIYINRSQKMENGTFLGIFVSNFWYCFFAVWGLKLCNKGANQCSLRR
jgi:hypothetical protein